MKNCSTTSHRDGVTCPDLNLWTVTDFALVAHRQYGAMGARPKRTINHGCNAETKHRARGSAYCRKDNVPTDVTPAAVSCIRWRTPTPRGLKLKLILIAKIIFYLLQRESYALKVDEISTHLAGIAHYFPCQPATEILLCASGNGK